MAAHFEPALRDWAFPLKSNPGLASSAKFSRPFGTKFEAAEKPEFFERDGLQAVHHCFVVCAALAAEGAVFLQPRLFAQPLRQALIQSRNAVPMPAFETPHQPNGGSRAFLAEAFVALSVRAREHPTPDRGSHGLSSVRNLKLAHDVVHMVANGVVADIESTRNLFVG